MRSPRLAFANAVIPVILFAVACRPAGSAISARSPLQVVDGSQDQIVLGRQLVVSHDCGGCHGGSFDPGGAGWLDGARSPLQEFRIGPCRRPGEEIGEETHEDHDQFIRVEEGTGRVVLDGEGQTLQDGSAVVIPAGVRHNVINTSGAAPLKLYTLYSPPEHAPDAVHHTRADAEAAEGAH